MVKRENKNVLFLIPNLYLVGLCLNISLVFREHPERPLLRWKAGDVSECVGVQRDRASGCCWRRHFSSSFRAGIWKGNIYRPPTDWSFTAALHNHTSINNACVNVCVCVWWLAEMTHHKQTSICRSQIFSFKYFDSWLVRSEYLNLSLCLYELNLNKCLRSRAGVSFDWQLSFVILQEGLTHADPHKHTWIWCDLLWYHPHLHLWIDL